MNNSVSAPSPKEQSEFSTAGFAGLVFILWISSYLCSAIHNPVFYWHLTLGHWIESHLALPITDLWTDAGVGKTWYSASWLFGVVLSVVERLGGDRGLIILKLGVIFFFCLTLHQIYSRYARSAFFGGCITALTAASAVSTGAFGPGLFGYALLLMVLHFTQSILSAPNSKLVLNSALLFTTLAIYVNIHISFYVAIFFCAALVFYATIAPRGRRVLILGIVVSSMFVTPYLGAQVPFIFLQAINFLRYILVLQTDPATIYHYSFALFLIMWALLAIVWGRRPESLGKTEILILSFSTLAGFASLTFVPFSAVVVGRAIAIAWGADSTGEASLLRQGIERLRRNIFLIKPVGLIWLLLCFIVVFIVNLIKLPKDMSALPTEAIDFVVEHDLSFPLLHDELVAPYIVYRLSDAHGEPRARPAFDQRTPGIDLKFAAQQLAFSRYETGWESFIEKVNPQTILCRQDGPLYLLLKQDSEWKRVFPLDASTDSEVSTGMISSPSVWVVFVRVNN